MGCNIARVTFVVSFVSNSYLQVIGIEACGLHIVHLGLVCVGLLGFVFRCSRTCWPESHLFVNVQIGTYIPEVEIGNISRTIQDSYSIISWTENQVVYITTRWIGVLIDRLTDVTFSISFFRLVLFF